MWDGLPEAEERETKMRKPLNAIRFFASGLFAVGVLAVAPAASADTNCAMGRCSTAAAHLRLDGRDALRTSIDTGWMPSCDGGQEHCNKGLQVRADIALTAASAGGSLFSADLPASAVVQASWDDPRHLVLSTDSIGSDSKLTITHSLTPQVELFVDIGPIEEGFTFPATRLVNMIPGAHFDYSASATGGFAGWAFDGAQLTVPPPSLQNSQLFSVDLKSFPDVINKLVEGSLALSARTSPTFTYKTTKVVVGGKELARGSMTQFDFPPGDLDFIEMPATIEAELSAKGEIEVMPSATLSRLGDLKFTPAATITFSSVKVTKSYDAPPQTYSFPDKVIHIPLPNVRKPLEGLDGGAVQVGTQGTVPAMMQNTGEATGLVTLESDDPRFVVPQKPITLGPKSTTALNITFIPDALGPAEAIITAHSNDPDSPDLTFRVTGEGVAEPVGPNGKRSPGDATEADGADTGCGCKTAGRTRGTSTGYAGLGAIALGLAALVRRRRR
jgi:MYXO-CTERM domain-containing protein